MLKGICDSRKRGVFASAVIKKRRYWPKFIKGDEIKDHFEGQELGHADCLRGVLSDTPFLLFGMRDAGFVSMFMTTYGTLQREGTEARRFVTNNGHLEKKRSYIPK